jgi:hypothetical protein
MRARHHTAAVVTTGVALSFFEGYSLMAVDLAQWHDVKLLEVR